MSKTLPKADFLRAIVARSGAHQTVVNDVLNAVAQVIRDATAAGQTVALPELGRFSLKTRAARAGRNIRTGEPIEIAERTTIAFRPSTART